jgi:rod shape-determining protein MreC
MRRGSQVRATSYLAVGLAMGGILLGFGGSLHVGALRSVAATTFEPVETVLSSAGDGLRGMFDTVTSIARLRGDNQRLQQQVAELQRQLAQAKQQGMEDAQLRGMLGLRQQLGLHTVSAQVIGRDPEGLAPTMTVRAGRADGVRPGMSVLGLHGLVGRVVAVQIHSSQVQLISDSRAPVNVLLATSHLNGTLHVSGSKLVMDVLDAPVNLSIDGGETVLTSGLGGNYPKGLPVAAVVRYQYQPYGVTQVADVAPLDDLMRLEYVMIDTDFVPDSAP